MKDEWARLVEPVQRGVEGRAFLWTGRKAEVGQRTETQITAANGGWCRLSGVVTDVGEMPTLDEWREGDSCQLHTAWRKNEFSAHGAAASFEGSVHRAFWHSSRTGGDFLLNPEL